MTFKNLTLIVIIAIGKRLWSIILILVCLVIQFLCIVSDLDLSYIKLLIRDECFVKVTL